METQENTLKEPRGRFTEIVITQCICVAIILISLLVTKYFFKGTYAEIKEWYNENICIGTDINEVLESDGEQDAV